MVKFINTVDFILDKIKSNFSLILLKNRIINKSLIEFKRYNIKELVIFLLNPKFFNQNRKIPHFLYLYTQVIHSLNKI